MKSILMIFAIVCFCATVEGQVVVQANNSALYNAGGWLFPVAGATPVSNNRYVDLKEGSPFFQNDWAKSSIVTGDGKFYTGVPIKLNLMENTVYLRDSTNKELVIGTPLKEIIIPVTGQQSAAHFVNGNVLPQQKKGWFLLLVNDSLSLVKGYKKVFEEHTSYGSATEYSIKTTDTYYVFLNAKEYQVRKTADFADVLPNKKTEIEQQAKQIGKMSKDEQLAAMAIFCNGLLKK